MNWRRICIGGCAIMVLIFAAGFGYFVEQAAMLKWFPPDWYVYIGQSSDPAERALNDGDIPMLLLMSCAPLGFCMIWIARLVMVIRGKK
jgi:hypothetical protein